MTKTSKRRNSSVEHRSTKRRKRSNNSHPIYSTRVITWEEQLTLPPRFHEERDVWPASKILRERGNGKRKEYMLEWEAHPTTGEVFEPTWEPTDNVGQELKREWQRTVGARRPRSKSLEFKDLHSSQTTAQINVLKTLPNNRRVLNRHIIPDSSAESEGIIICSSPSRTPTLTGSSDSSESLPSPIEISETQQPRLPAPIEVIVPPAPTDKSDWESLRGSQFSQYTSLHSFSSPFSGNLLQEEQSPNSVATQQQKTSSHHSSSTNSSTRLTQSIHQDRGKSLRRILNYQPVHNHLSSVSDLPQTSTASDLQGGILVTPDKTSPLKVLTAQSRFSQQRSTEESQIYTHNWKPASQIVDLIHSKARSANGPVTQPWVFQSQLPVEVGVSSTLKSASQPSDSSLSGRCTRRKTTKSVIREADFNIANSGRSVTSQRFPVAAGMAARGTRQSPRLQTAVPNIDTTSPRIAVRTNSFRARSSLNPPEHSSPLASSAELAEPDQDLVRQSQGESSFTTNLPVEHNSSGMSTIPPTSIAPSAMHIDPIDTSMLGSMSQGSNGSDVGLNLFSMPVQESIEEEAISSAEEASLASKASSSQESLRNERLVPQVDGLVMPTYPILGEDEYAIGLPAEGKVQAIYSQTIKVKRKAILKFIRRRGSVNHASTSTKKTIERNEMIELVGRLHDTTTHIDLGLPGIPTQYNIPSQEHAAYAEYAGSKFVFLGYLIDFFKRRPETIVIMAKSGATQDLLEEYLYMKNVQVRRHERAYDSQLSQESTPTGPKVELLSTKADEVVEIVGKPCLIIAFDASFESLDAQVKSLRAQSSVPLPIIHLLVTNSSEHVERCLPASMPSPIRLRLLVRATYQACLNLGGSPTIFTNASDELDGRPMDLADIQRAVRKSPNRRLEMVAAVVANATLSDKFASNWTLNSMPELVLDELDESPSTSSTVSATPGRSRNRSQTPVSRLAGSVRNRSQTPTSRATTPSARKRQLEVDAATVNKRQRTTPINDYSDVMENDAALTREQELHRIIDSLRVELANEKRARQAAEDCRTVAEKRANEWQTSLASLQRRYERRTKDSHKQQKVNKNLMLAVENNKLRMEKLIADNGNLRQQLQQQKTELEAARAILVSAGGDIAALETAREEARSAVAKAVMLDKSLNNTKRDFDFLRTQYQDASNKAAELGSQVTKLEAQNESLSTKASDEKRRLKELNYTEELKQHLARISQLEAEKRSILVIHKKLEEESKLLKRNRGVQTRGSSTAPGSPGQRSRQGSPAVAPPSGSRASALRHER